MSNEIAIDHAMVFWPGGLWSKSSWFVSLASGTGSIITDGLIASKIHITFSLPTYFVPPSSLLLIK